MVGLINGVLVYITIGVLLMAIFDLINFRLREEDEEYAELGEFTFGERVMIVLFWPFSLMVFLDGFFRGPE